MLMASNLGKRHTRDKTTDKELEKVCKGEGQKDEKNKYILQTCKYITYALFRIIYLSICWQFGSRG